MPMIDRFHEDPDTWIFLISTLAGGTGLNLVGANRVVIFGESLHSALAGRGLSFGQIQIGVSFCPLPQRSQNELSGKR